MWHVKFTILWMFRGIWQLCLRNAKWLNIFFTYYHNLWVIFFVILFNRLSTSKTYEWFTYVILGHSVKIRLIFKTSLPKFLLFNCCLIKLLSASVSSSSSLPLRSLQLSLIQKYHIMESLPYKENMVIGSCWNILHHYIWELNWTWFL